jgi:hypothetical protein
VAREAVHQLVMGLMEQHRARRSMLSLTQAVAEAASVTQPQFSTADLAASAAVVGEHAALSLHRLALSIRVLAAVAAVAVALQAVQAALAVLVVSFSTSHKEQNGPLLQGR